MWPVFPSVTHTCKCDNFCYVWPIFKKYDSFSHTCFTLPIVTHFFKRDPLFLCLKCDSFSISDLFANCDPHFLLWPIFLVRPIIFKCDPLFLNVTSCDPFCSVWLIFPSAAILISATHVYKVWLIFPSLTLFAKCDPFCPVWLILASATIFVTCDPCL